MQKTWSMSGPGGTDTVMETDAKPTLTRSRVVMSVNTGGLGQCLWADPTRQGHFQNLSHTQDLLDTFSWLSVMEK